MSSKTTFLLLLMLSFSLFHDSFISLIDHPSQSHIQSSLTHNWETTTLDISEIHKLFHFVAILATIPNYTSKVKTQRPLALVLHSYHPPFPRISHRPPIA